MVHIDTLALGSYQTNCYIVSSEESRCIIIDPGYDAPTIKGHLQKKGFIPEAILLTHGHFDHVGAVKELAMDFDCPVWIHPAESTMPPMMTAGPLYFTNTYSGGETLEIAGLSIFVRHTPGHTPGSVCLTIGDCIFTGDTLFAGSCGRTDLPGGDWATILSSLRTLKELPLNYRIFPGHGEDSTLDNERKYNPYMR